MIKRLILMNIALLIAVIYSNAQKNGFGFSLIANPQTESYGFDIRYEIVKQNFSIVPQVAYYPPIAYVHEFYIGSSIHYNVFSKQSLQCYALGNVSFNGWLNYADSPMKNPSFAHLDVELGGGVQYSKCIKPFLEYRYNLWWRETNIRIGLIFVPHCKATRSSVPCPGV